MVASLLTLPLRLGMRLAAATVEETVVLGARAAGLLAELIAPRQSPDTGPDVPPEASAGGDVVVPPDVPDAAGALADEVQVPVPPPEPAHVSKAPAHLREEPAHVSEEPELVREDADPGAEEGAGAQLRVAEPWTGYHLMHARDVIDRLASASPEELAAVELYERSHRRRKTVVAAAERALKLATPPGRQATQPPPT